MNDMVSPETVRLLLPELLLVALATWTYVGGAFIGGRIMWNAATALGLALVTMVMLRSDAASGVFSTGVLQTSGPLAVDYFGHAARWVVLAVGWLLFLASTRSASDDWATEYLGSLLLVIAGLMLAATAGDLALLFLALELVSIPSYILLFLGRRGGDSHEATVKYFFLSILSSAVLLYGLSFLYGAAGTTSLVGIRETIAGGELAVGSGGGLLLKFALVLIFGGICFKFAAVPFHFYAPDVYQGTNASNAGLLAAVPKLAGVIAVMRLVVYCFPALENVGWQLALTVAVVTMTLGNVTALWQQNIRRLLAYSSIAHAGYMLVGLAAGLAAADSGTAPRVDGLAAMGFYAVLYVVAAVGTFAALAHLGRRDREIESVDELAGLSQTHPVVATCLAVFMFSMAGIPPLAGFLGKLAIFLGVLEIGPTAAMPTRGAWFLALAVIGVLNAAIAAAYYLRIVATMYFRQSVHVPRAEGGTGPMIAAFASAVLIVTATLLGGRLLSAANHAAASASGRNTGPATAAAPWETSTDARQHQPSG